MSAHSKPPQGSDPVKSNESETWVKVPTDVDANGDKVVTLYDEHGRPYTLQVAELVLGPFDGLRPQGHVRFKDGDRLNCARNNLEWVLETPATGLWDKLVKSHAARGSRTLVRTWWDGLDDEPYVVAIGVPTTFDLSSVKFQDFRGLLAVYTVSTTPSGDLKLISHWKTAEAYKGSKSTFFATLKIAAGSTPMAEGHQLRAAARPPKLGWLRRHLGAVIGFLGVLAGIIGNVEKFRDPVLSLFLTPDVQITAARESVDILSGEEFDAEFTVRNVSDWVSSDVSFQKIVVQPPDAVSIDTTLPGPFIGLAPGGTEVMKIHGVARSSTARGQIKTKVSLAGRAETWIRSRRQALAAGHHLTIWPRRTVGVKQVGDVTHEGKRCRIDCQFMIGDEFTKGFEIQAQLSNADDIVFQRVQFLGDPKLDSLPQSGSSPLTQVRWQVKDLKPGKLYQFSLYAQSGRKRDEEQWRAVAQRTTVDFGSLPPGT